MKYDKLGTSFYLIFKLVIFSSARIFQSKKKVDLQNMRRSTLIFYIGLEPDFVIDSYKRGFCRRIRCQHVLR